MYLTSMSGAYELEIYARNIKYLAHHSTINGIFSSTVRLGSISIG